MMTVSSLIRCLSLLYWAQDIGDIDMSTARVCLSCC